MVATPAAGAVGAVGTSAATGTADVAASNATGPGCNYSITVTDASGTDVTLEEPAERVVTIGPASAQTMWELGAQEKVVGTTPDASYLDGADAKTNISGAGRTYVSVEKVVAQNPDVVLAENITSPETVTKLREAGVTVYYFDRAESLDDVYDKVGRTGRLVGECDAAIETVRTMKEELAIVREATDGEDPKKFLYAFYGFTIGENTFIHEALTEAGGENIAIGEVEFPPSGYAQINPETVASLDVQWLVYPGSKAAIPDNAAYEETTAMQEENLIQLDSNHISQPAPRVALAIRSVAQTWHPEAYAEADQELRGNVEVTVDLYGSSDTGTTDNDPVTTDDETTTDDGTTADDGTDDGMDDGESTETTEATTAASGDDGTTADGENGGAPGFGPVAALVAGALLVVSALVRRD